MTQAPGEEKVDVLIVGSGPAGVSTALHLLQLNPAWAQRMIVIDKAVHPRDKVCGGGITHMGQNVLADLGLSIETQNFEVREVRLVYGAQSYSFRGNPVFRIAHRREFDHWLVTVAETRGAEVRQGEAVEDVTPADDYVRVVTSKGVYLAQVLVVADGAHSFIHRKLKWPESSGKAQLLDVLTPEDPIQLPAFRDGLAVFDFTPLQDGLQGYYWDFPGYVHGQAHMNRGVFDSRTDTTIKRAPLKQILSTSMSKRDRTLSDYKLQGNPIRWFDKHGTFAKPRIILTGGAAGVDPLFGEGISYALGYGKVAAASIRDAFATQNFDFADYRDRITKDPLLSQLAIRVSLARRAYLLRYPWVIRLGWRLVRFGILFTRWRNPENVPARAPKLDFDYSP